MAIKRAETAILLSEKLSKILSLETKSLNIDKSLNLTGRYNNYKYILTQRTQKYKTNNDVSEGRN